MEKNKYTTIAMYLCDEIGWPIKDSVHMVTIADGETDFEMAEKLLIQCERIIAGDYGKK